MDLDYRRKLMEQTGSFYKKSYQLCKYLSNEFKLDPRMIREELRDLQRQILKLEEMIEL